VVPTLPEVTGSKRYNNDVGGESESMYLMFLQQIKCILSMMLVYVFEVGTHLKSLLPWISLL